MFHSNSILATTLKFDLEKNINSRFRSCFSDKLTEKLRELMKVCCWNQLHAQELQKKAHDKGVKSCRYTLNKKISLK